MPCHPRRPRWHINSYPISLRTCALSKSRLMKTSSCHDNRSQQRYEFLDFCGTCSRNSQMIWQYKLRVSLFSRTGTSLRMMSMSLRISEASASPTRNSIQQQRAPGPLRQSQKRPIRPEAQTSHESPCVKQRPAQRGHQAYCRIVFL